MENGKEENRKGARGKLKNYKENNLNVQLMANNLSCNLSDPELQKRKSTILKDLREQVLERKELRNGFAFKFPGNDEMLNQLHEFIKTERQCCPFFTFQLTVKARQKSIWLKLTGPLAAKDFIVLELQL